MAFCANCGNEVAPNAAACLNCGHPTGVGVALPGAQGRTDGSAIGALILGIMGIISCPLVLSIPAIILGKKSLAAIEADPSLQGDGMARAGVVLGWIGVALGILGVIIIAAAIFLSEATTYTS